MSGACLCVLCMASGKKDRQNEKNNRRERSSFRPSRRKGRFSFDLHPVTKKWIGGILLLGLSFILFLGFFDAAGPVGAFFKTNAFRLFGWTAPMFPLILLLIAVVLFSSKERAIWASSIAGSILFIIGLTAILDVVGEEELRRGGTIGYWAAYMPLKGFGPIASVIFFGALSVVGLLMLFNYPASSLYASDEQIGMKTKIAGVVRAIISMLAYPLSFLRRSTSGGQKIQRPSLFSENDTNGPAFKVHKLESESDAFPQERIFDNTVARDTKIKPQKIHVPYTPPPVNLLDEDKGKPTSGDIKANMHIIKRTLSNFGIEVEMGEVAVGPTVTQYTLKPAEGVKLVKITALANDLALALAAHPIRIEAPIPGRSLVGIEIPNHAVTLVRLKNLLEHEQFQGSSYRLAFALGRDVAGNPMYAALEKMPHLLIAGATGTGKTIALNSLLMSLLYRNPPSLMRFLLVDPKRVEFPIYNGIPHLLTPVIVDVQRTINALKWAVREMDRRFDVLAGAKARDIGIYNRELKKGEDPMPYIVIVIDELADLMAARGKEVEAVIVRLAQMARAVGIHLVVATQRPSVEVITGLIKANITSRMAFQVASQIDSRTIVDNAGAEKLLGNGDMLFMSAESSKPRRLQGGYVSDKEVKRVVDFLKKGVEELDYDTGIVELYSDPGGGGDAGSGADNLFGDEDPLYEEAKSLVIQARKASASYLQRRLRIGYARAARLIDILEERGVVGPGEGAKPREILMGGIAMGGEDRNADELDEGDEYK